MSPALLAAIATIVPTVSTPARAPASTQPAAAKTDAVPSSVTSAMPDVGCDETPTMPTMRAATVTNSTPKTPTPAAQHRALQRRHVPGEDAGHEAGDEHDDRDAAEHEAGGQVAVGRARPRRRVAVPRRRSPRATARKAPAIVGSPRSTVRMPAVATAPAPM